MEHAPGLLDASLSGEAQEQRPRQVGVLLTSASALFVCEVAAVAGRFGAEGQVGISTASTQPELRQEATPSHVDTAGPHPSS